MPVDHNLWLDRALDMASTLVADGDRIPVIVVARALLRLNSRVETLFDAIAHGDDAHRAWLKAKIEEHIHAAPT